MDASSSAARKMSLLSCVVYMRLPLEGDGRLARGASPVCPGTCNVKVRSLNTGVVSVFLSAYMRGKKTEKTTQGQNSVVVCFMETFVER